MITTLSLLTHDCIFHLHRPFKISLAVLNDTFVFIKISLYGI